MTVEPKAEADSGTKWYRVLLPLANCQLLSSASASILFSSESLDPLALFSASKSCLKHTEVLLYKHFGRPTFKGWFLYQKTARGGTHNWQMHLIYTKKLSSVIQVSKEEDKLLLYWSHKWRSLGIQRLGGREGAWGGDAQEHYIKINTLHTFLPCLQVLEFCLEKIRR